MTFCRKIGLTSLKNFLSKNFLSWNRHRQIMTSQNSQQIFFMSSMLFWQFLWLCIEFWASLSLLSCFKTSWSNCNAKISAFSEEFHEKKLFFLSFLLLFWFFNDASNLKSSLIFLLIVNKKKLKIRRFEYMKSIESAAYQNKSDFMLLIFCADKETLRNLIEKKT